MVSRTTRINSPHVQYAESNTVEPLEKWTREGDIVWVFPRVDLYFFLIHAFKVSGHYLAELNYIIYSPSASIMSYFRIKTTGNGTQVLVIVAPCISKQPRACARGGHVCGRDLRHGATVGNGETTDELTYAES